MPACFMTALIPFNASFQAHRYGRMGHQALFTNSGVMHTSDLIQQAIALVADPDGLSQDRLSEAELAGRCTHEDADRLLWGILRDLGDGFLLPVRPNAAQQQQIQADGIALHPFRRDLVITAVEHYAARSVATGIPATHLPGELSLLADDLRNGKVVLIKTA